MTALLLALSIMFLAYKHRATKKIKLCTANKVIGWHLMDMRLCLKHKQNDVTILPRCPNVQELNSDH